MKIYIYLIFFSLLVACAKPEYQKKNSILLLKVDYLSHNFEGGKELYFENNDNFTLDIDYQSPGDFGYLNINYKEVNKPIFEGTLVWMGNGKRSFPEYLKDSTSFTYNDVNIKKPLDSYFENILNYQAEISNQELWDAISKLQIVANYRRLNSNSKIYFFPYYSSQGVGDPKDWDYYIILKN